MYWLLSQPQWCSNLNSIPINMVLVNIVQPYQLDSEDHISSCKRFDIVMSWPNIWLCNSSQQNCLLIWLNYNTKLKSILFFSILVHIQQSWLKQFPRPIRHRDSIPYFCMDDHILPFMPFYASIYGICVSSRHHIIATALLCIDQQFSCLL